ncbi:alkaline phosphatase [Nitritalea halalkaliphila]|uniref:alkaline phosphatase n=1 Tax=Nitritalea halalkaliphila TaxID=590849 RepID=UPI0021CDA332|nr:alkaline phosphatase [Nitritalea halalkaliphila]
MKHKLGRTSTWISAYEQGIMRRGLMDTQSANSWITDSAAAGSAWGGGMRVNNGALNVGPNGERPTPILQKFKAAGKAVGCVTSVTITHATPAAFCVNSNSRNSQPEIAVDYLDLRFDVMMGGGANFFAPAARKDERNLFQEFTDKGFHVARTKAEMLASDGSKPLLGVFSDDGLPYAIDRENDPELKEKVPSLAEMTRLAIQNLSKTRMVRDASRRWQGGLGGSCERCPCTDLRPSGF